MSPLVVIFGSGTLVLALLFWAILHRQEAFRRLALSQGFTYQFTLARTDGLDLIHGTSLTYQTEHNHDFTDLVQGERRGLGVTALKHRYGIGKMSTSETVFCIDAGKRQLDLSQANSRPLPPELHGFRVAVASGRLLFYKPGFVVGPGQFLPWLDRVLDVVEPWATKPVRPPVHA